MTTRRRLTESEPFGNYLRSLMRRRRVSVAALAIQVGKAPTTIYYWRTGHNLPILEDGIRLAEILDDARLLQLLQKARTRRCVNASCSQTFERSAGRKAIYCSPRCERLVNQKGLSRREPRQDAIDAMCRACEPEGICRQSECALRPFSPFLFVPLRRVA